MMLFPIVCPFCYQKFSKSEIKYRCENRSCVQENDPQLAAYFGDLKRKAHHIISPKSSRPFFNVRKKFLGVNQMNCDLCNQVSHKKVCPHCHNPLPVNIHRAESHIISIVGARASGKTHFITVLIKELTQNGFYLDLVLRPEDIGEEADQTTTKRYYRDYKNPLFDKGKTLKKTNPGDMDHFPLIYKLSSTQKDFFQNQVIYLAFYDTAGENFTDQNAISKMANYVTNTSGIIFLMDTFQIPTVRQELRNKGVVIQTESTGFMHILQQVDQLFEKLGKIKFKGNSQLPVALTFSKIDEVIKNGLLGDARAPMLIREDSDFYRTRVYSEDHINRNSDEMKSLLNYWGESGFINYAESLFRNVKYFGVSALGHTPNGEEISADGIKPHRVMDPLVWILDQLNFALPKNK